MAKSHRMGPIKQMSTENQKPQTTPAEDEAPGALERAMLVYQLILSRTELWERFQAAWDRLEEGDETAQIELTGIESEMMAQFRKAARLAEFDFLPADDEDLADLKLRFQAQAIVRYLSTAEDPGEFDTTLKELLADARELAGLIGKDYNTGLAKTDEYLAVKEIAVIAAYYPELMDGTEE